MRNPFKARREEEEPPLFGATDDGGVERLPPTDTNMAKTSERLAAWVGQPVQPPSACVECGGLFLLEKLLPLLVVTVSLGWNTSSSKQLYCAGCKPKADVKFELQGKEGDLFDYRFFQLGDGYFAEVDEKGEDIFSTTVEEYSHLVCEGCGEPVTEETKCSNCRKPEKKTSR